MRRQVVGVIALATLGACSTASGVATIEAYEIGWEDPDDEGVQQRNALAGAPCIDPGSRVERDLSKRVDDWRKVVDCDQPHPLQIVGTVPAPADVVDAAPLYDRDSAEYLEIREEVAVACARRVERQLGLEVVTWDPALDDGMLFQPADDDPYDDFFTPVPAAMWDSGHRELACYVKHARAVEYSLSEFTSRGAAVPAEERTCFDDRWAVSCDEEHVTELFIDIDVTGLVDAGTIDPELAMLEPTDDAPEGLLLLDEMCWSAADALGLPLEPELFAWAWIDRPRFPTAAGRYDVHCVAETTRLKATVSGSVFD